MTSYLIKEAIDEFLKEFSPESAFLIALKQLDVLSVDLVRDAVEGYDTSPPTAREASSVFYRTRQKTRFSASKFKSINPYALTVGVSRIEAALDSLSRKVGMNDGQVVGDSLRGA
jgi:hypothetical protein